MTASGALTADRRDDPGRLLAETVEVEDSSTLDLLAAAGEDGIFWHHGDVAFAAIGEAARIELPDGLVHTERVADAVAAVGGEGALAVGALPFHRRAAGHLVVPQALLIVRGDGARLTTVGAAGDHEADAAGRRLLDAARTPQANDAEEPDGFDLASPVSQAAWKGIVADAVAHIATGALDKVVLARAIEVRANRPFVTGRVLARLLALYPSCTVFRVEGFLGATPELLIERRGRAVRSGPLAGTVARSGDVAADQALVEGIMASAKNRQEHRYVLDGIRAALAPVCTRLDIPEEPEIMELRNVSHLSTPIRAELAADHSASALDLLARIHPTPAYGGTPTDAAVEWLTRVEGFDRGHYAGPVGWLDGSGDGTWVLGIRSAEVHGAEATLFAGNGIVAGSDPVDELAETQLKLQALLAALVRP